ncbi:MAG: carboxypeptidase regulatory-like domain-containing protein [Isosphaeraceae bacterium]|nr:carboxypeptidase regulatory-like domain-containing protein [Isosphaeraceae bacterium]
MAWHDLAWSWLVHAALGGSLVLGVGCLAVGLCRQPVRRLRLMALTLVGCLLVPVLNRAPGMPRWSLGRVVPARRAPEPAEVAHAGSLSPEVILAERRFALRPESPPGARPEAAPRPVAQQSNDGRMSEPVRIREDGPRFAWVTRSISIRTILLIAYGLIAAGLLGWWLAGQVILLRLCRSATPAPRAVEGLLRAIAGSEAGRVRLLVSDRIELPFTFTWRRPVILLPAGLCREGEEEPLRYGLAHEWSHIERRDVWTWNLANLVQLILFYQPLYWWLRRQLRLCQDYLADAQAAEQAPAAEDYADYLVGLARWGAIGRSLPALGIGGRHSNLYRRIVMLVQDPLPLERRCRAGWSLAMTAAAVVVIVAISALRLDAGARAEEPKPQAEAQAAKEKENDTPKDKNKDKEARVGEARTYSGRVTDKETGQPIAGATVTVRRSVLPDPQTGENKVLEETKHRTDAEGKYQFTIPPEQVAEPRLYIELDVEHPDYAPQMGFGYALSMIRKNETLGGRPFYESIQLRPGKAITGRVETPDGRPAAGIEVRGFSKPESKSRTFEFGSFAKGKTDEQGQFRLVLTTPGPAVFWLLPADYAPSLHVLKDNKRGDLGLFVLQKGIEVRGKVLDAQGQPVAGVNVNIERDRQQSGDEEILNQLNVADAIGRSAVTDEKGEFAMFPLPPGTYRIQPDEDAHGYPLPKQRHRPLPAVFIAQKVTLREGEIPELVEIRAVPHVVIEAQYYDSQGKPRSGHSCFLFGRIDGGFWHTEGHPTPDGKIVIRAPHGLEQAQLDLMTNEHGALRHRLAKDKPLENNRQVMLGTLDHDIKGIEIIRYTAPIVLVKVVDPDGRKPQGARVIATYPEGRSQFGGRLILPNGERSDVSFEEQEDGRFRSEQLFPDEEVTITAKADGYRPRSEKLKLPEGAIKELEIVLEPGEEPAQEKQKDKDGPQD